MGGFVAIVGFVLLLVWSGPEMIRQMPGRYRYYLPSELVAAVTTPLPPALPTVGPTAVLQAVLVPTETAVPTITHTPSAETAVSPTPLQTNAETTAIPEPTATLLPTPAPTATPDPLPPTAQLSGLEIIPQKFNNCGPANLTMLLNYHGFPSEQLAVAAHIRPHYEDRNVTPSELVDYVESETGFKAVAYSGGTVRMLKELLALGLPVIVEKGLVSSDDEGWLGHYLTLSGYDEAEQAFTTLDTLLGPWEGDGEPLAYAELETFWQQFNYTFVLVYPPEQDTAVFQILPHRELPDMWQAAAVKAQADIDQTPDNAFAWFNLGTNLARLGEINGDETTWATAAAAFDQARALGLPPRMLWYQFQPYVAYLANGRYQDVLTLAEATLISQGGRHVEETYYYQGLALQATEDLDGAQLAFKRATQIHPYYKLAEDALIALRADG